MTQVKRPRGLFVFAILAVVFAGGFGARLCADSPNAPSPRKAPDVPGTERLRLELRRMIEYARDRVFPALVNIHVVTVNYWDGKEQKGRAVGSGTIISREGYVLTNQHVTDDGKKFRCTLSDKQEIRADLVAEDPLTDLAVLKLDLSQYKGSREGLPVAEFGNSDDLEVGDYVMAMGSPLALSRSVTLGIVSNAQRVFGGGDEEQMELESGQQTGLFTRWIQHDALIHPGNSGGPLVNLQGQIVGVNELGGASMGFAIPSNLARSVMVALIEKKEVARSWIGVSFKPIEKTGLDHGVLVNSIVKEGPAAEAGIHAGDVIVRVDGDPVTVRFAEEIPQIMKRFADLSIGRTVSIDYEREGKSGQASVVTRKLEKDRGEETVLRSWGIVVEEITSKLARDRRLDSMEGACVGSVRSGGPAQLAEPPFAAGDIIRNIDGEPVKDLKAIVALYEKIMAREKLPEHLLVGFDRGGKNNVTLLKPKPEEDEPPPREVPKAWIGVATQPVVDKLAHKLGHPKESGYRVTRVYPHTLAAGSEIRIGDVIIALNGQKLRPKGMQDYGLFSRAVRGLNIDDQAALTILRDKKKQEVSVKLERTRITPEEARRERNRDFELTVRELTFFDRDENRWDESVEGVLVEHVESAGWAGLGGVDGDDLIQKINQYDIKGLKSFKRAMAAIAKEQPQRVVVKVLRGVQTRFQYLEPEWKPVIDGQKPAGDDQKKKE